MPISLYCIYIKAFQWLPQEHVWCAYDAYLMFIWSLQKKHMVISVSNVNDAPLSPIPLSCIQWSGPISATRACMMFIWCSSNVQAMFTKIHGQISLIHEWCSSISNPSILYSLKRSNFCHQSSRFSNLSNW